MYLRRASCSMSSRNCTSANARAIASSLSGASTAVTSFTVAHSPQRTPGVLPTNEQRSVKSEMFGTEGPEERAEYVAAFEFILDVLSRLNEQGVLLLPGTDLGGGIAYHRELELFEKIGLTPAEVLRRASYDMAVYLEQDEDLGSIEKGKYADFFLVPGDPTEDLGQLRQIRMVVSDGVVYYPTEIYPWFGIRPFSEVPPVTAPDQAASN